MLFRVNGVEVARIHREAPGVRGQVGVSIGAMAPGGARVVFDRFIATEDR